MKSLIIAEKPNVAKEIINMLESSFDEIFHNKGDYKESQNYIVSNFFGHLLEMEKPQAYGEKYKTWSFETLPILPNSFLYKYSADKHKQGKLLSDISKNVSCIINATDPDREGEGIFRLWYNYEKINKPVKRFWFTSLTLKDLTKSWNILKDSKEYDLFYNSQKARSEADWLVGMNASRAYSIVTADRCPVGRVKTAVLNLIVSRDYDVENYKESFSYSLTGLWNNYKFTFYQDNDYKFDEKSFVENIYEKIKNDNFSLVSFNKEEKRKNPPKVFNQADLQKEASKKFDFSGKKTLEINQSLYEKKLVTYPRTDSPYLPESDLKEYYALVNSLANEEQKKLLLPGSKPPTVLNTDAAHTGIIPTGNKPFNLSNDEQLIYDLICQRFITAFMIPKIYDEYVLYISNSYEKFKSTLISIKDNGFENQYHIKDKNDNENLEIQEVKSIEENFLKSLNQKISALQINSIKRTKPKYYTDETLIDAMINCGRNLDNKESKVILSEIEGLGTAATRHTFPEELINDSFIYKKGKNFISTEKGRNLIEIICPELKSVEKTADLEKKLRLIEKGSVNLLEFRTEIDNYVQNFIDFTISNQETIKEVFKTNLPCPKCSKPLSRFYKCEDENCGFSFYNKVAGLQLSKSQVEQLFKNKKTDIIKGFTSKKNQEFSAKLILNADFEIEFDFEKESLGNCSCGGNIVESLKAFNCDKCKKTVWKIIYEKKISTKTAISLMQFKKVKISGLKSKENKTFDAIVFLDQEGKIKLQFDNKK